MEPCRLYRASTKTHKRTQQTDKQLTRKVERHKRVAGEEEVEKSGDEVDVDDDVGEPGQDPAQSEQTSDLTVLQVLE